MATTLHLSDRSLFVLAAALRYVQANLDELNEAMGCYGTEDDAVTARLIRVTASDGAQRLWATPSEPYEITDILDTILPDVIATSL